MCQQRVQVDAPHEAATDDPDVQTHLALPHRATCPLSISGARSEASALGAAATLGP
jgi:hypothetical protein